MNFKPWTREIFLSMKITFNFESFFQKSNQGLYGLCTVISPIDFSYEDFCVATFGFGFGKVKMKVRDMDVFWNNHALFGFFESDIFLKKIEFSGIWYLRKKWGKHVNLSTKTSQNIGEKSEIYTNLRIKISEKNPK